MPVGQLKFGESIFNNPGYNRYTFWVAGICMLPNTVLSAIQVASWKKMKKAHTVTVNLTKFLVSLPDNKIAEQIQQ